MRSSSLTQSRWNVLPGEFSIPRSRISQLAFVLFVLLTLNVILRPAELIAVLEGLSIYETLIAATLFCVLSPARDQLLPQVMKVRPITACVVGLTIAIPLSHLSHAWISGAIESTNFFIKTVLYFLLLITIVNTASRLRIFLLGMAIFTTITVGICVADFRGIIDVPFIEPVVQLGELLEAEKAELGELPKEVLMRVTRMCGTGIFKDPNDISQLIVAVGVIITYFLFDQRKKYTRFLWIIPLIILGMGLVYTKSRGGMLSAAIAVLTYIALRYGGRMSVLAILLGLCMLPFMAGRQGDIDIEDGSGQERIQMWSEGLQELKSPSILFGIGHGLYGDIAGLVAHNSYVHAFVELGLFGGTFFVGLFLFSGLGLQRLYTLRSQIRDPEMRRLLPFMGAMLAGWAMGLFSLSRCYVPPTYLIIGIVSNYIHIVEQDMVPRRVVTRWDSDHVKLLALTSVSTLVFLYVFVKVFARF
ncbi:MAG: O-antigen ligase family protein [Planctomycetales bacterium]